jgi:Cupredoxin-like domain
LILLDRMRLNSLVQARVLGNPHMTRTNSTRLLSSSVLLLASFLGAPACSKADAAAEQAADTKPASGTVAITVDGKGFTPSEVVVAKGSTTTLRFTRTTDGTCATAVAFPELKLEKPLPLNQPVDVVVPAAEARTLTFQCGMGMYKSKVVVR